MLAIHLYVELFMSSSLLPRSYCYKDNLGSYAFVYFVLCLPVVKLSIFRDKPFFLSSISPSSYFHILCEDIGSCFCKHKHRYIFVSLWPFYVTRHFVEVTTSSMHMHAKNYNYHSGIRSETESCHCLSAS